MSAPKFTIPDAGADRIYNQIAKQQTNYSNWLQSKQFSNFSVPTWEMCGLIQANSIAEGYRKLIIGLDMNDARRACKGLESIFDLMPIWRYKFATGDGQFNQNSSVYYLSPSGCGIRIKYANTYNKNAFDREGVIMNVMEKCFFNSLSQKIEKPIVGFAVKELSSSSFLFALNAGQLFYISSLNRYVDNGNNFIAMGHEKNKCTIMKHEGHEVSKIFWQK